MATYNIRYNRLRYLLELINKKSPLSRAQLAKKFECSEDTITRMINELRYYENHNIRYSKSLQRYVLMPGSFYKE